MSQLELRGAVAVVTGGAGGIGHALSRRLGSEGCRVAVVDLEASRAQSAASAIEGAIGVGADVGDPAAVRSAVEQIESQLGPIDIYCSNAGIAVGAGLGENADWEASWRVHGMAHVNAAREVLPGMAARGRGAFVVTASAAGLLMMMQSAAYTATKHASVAIAEWLAVNYGGTGVQFHCLCPQGVRTPMVQSDTSGQAELTASGNIIEPEQVADAVLAAIRDNKFLVLPHPEVHGYEKMKVEDRDRWLAGMRRLLSRVTG
ncbi:MAG TPA: SDR family oxidoreductase [Acidimicrobiales bacterium]|nr:SDR family oxidoreductase [Acidimicrobiales bacterium]